MFKFRTTKKIIANHIIIDRLEFCRLKIRQDMRNCDEKTAEALKLTTTAIVETMQTIVNNDLDKLSKSLKFKIKKLSK